LNRRLLFLTCALALVACGDREPDGLAMAGDLPALENDLRPQLVGEFHRLPPTPVMAIDVRLEPAQDGLSGRQRLWYPNATGTPLTTIALRCPANAPAFKGAGVTIGAARWNGEVLSPPLLSADGSGFTWNLPKPLANGAQGLLEFPFTAHCSISGGFHGLMARNQSRWCLYHWHPELARWRNGGWSLTPVTGIGDESQTPLAHLTVRLSVPPATQVIAGGAVTAPLATADGWQQVAISAPESRNLAIALANNLVVSERVVAGIRVRSWAVPEHPHAGARALRLAADSLALYDRTFGPYPFNHLEVVESDQADDVGGMESSGLVFIDSKAYAGCEYEPATATIETLPGLELGTAVTHEVAHQWWYGIVGSDAFYDPWLDESLANWTCGWALEQMYGPLGRTSSLNLNFAGTSSLHGTSIPALDAPLSSFPSMNTYGVVVYARGVLMYEALRLRLGDQRFLGWLRRWQEQHRFAVVTPATWHAALAAEVGEREANEFTRLWIQGIGLDQRQLQAPLTKRPTP
jgi:Peptidase family M1 domain